MRFDLRMKFVVIALVLVVAVIVLVGFLLNDALSPSPKHAAAIREVLLVAGAAGLGLALGAALLSVAFVRRTLTRLSHQI